MIRHDLCGPWTLYTQDGRCYPAAAPGSALRSLLDAGAIPDPFDALNEHALQPLMMESCAFERTFRADAALLENPHIDLVCEGLDTLAEIRINGKKIAAADNMHRTWRFPVKEFLTVGENRIRADFSSAMAYVNQAAKDDPEITYEGGSDLLGTGALRKAHYMFGWDWGPRLPDAGIWRDIYLEGYAARLEDVRVHQVHEGGRVRLEVALQTAAPMGRITLFDPDGNQAAQAEGASGGPLHLDVPNPQLWWPNGLGGHPLYTLKAEALDGAVQDEKTLRIGLRTLTVSTEKDEWGNEFAFCCNGVKFFAMGADYIPEDNLLSRVTKESTARLLQDCVRANFNCIRIWGGGVYPDDHFMTLCDELGLVVWMDMMFACNVYRMTPAFEESITREAEDNLRRLRHHASLGLVCGNNEMETAWKTWGNVMNHSAELRADYLRQFEVVLRGVSEREAPDSFYWPSSPSSGGNFDDPNDLNRGDVHDWSVWHGREPFSNFEKRYPRFCSEFGFESFPCMRTLETFAHAERDMNPFSEVMESHQKCRSGNATMIHYIAQTLPYPFSMAALVHASQYLQAEAMRAGVEHWRRSRGRCMGAIYWQLNDCWPVASWASIDSLGRWKALQYAAKRFFAPVMVSVRRDESYHVHVCVEQREGFRGQVVCKARKASGEVLCVTAAPVDCAPLSAGEVLTLPCDPEIQIMQVILLDEKGRAVSENLDLAIPPKHFPFESASVRAECIGSELLLTASAFCLGVAVEAGDAVFTDNWFALYPGETRVISADRPFAPDEVTLRWIGME